MKDLLNTLFTMVIGLGVLVIALLIVYGLGVVPSGQMERARSDCGLLDPGAVRDHDRLVDPSDPNDLPEPVHRQRRLRSSSGSPTTAEIWSRKDTRLTVVNNLTWVIVGTVATTVFALSIARFADGMKNEKAAKALIFLPAAISLAGAGIIWRFVYASPPFKVGLLSAVTKSIPGLPASCGGAGDRHLVARARFRAVSTRRPPRRASTASC